MWSNYSRNFAQFVARRAYSQTVNSGTVTAKKTSRFDKSMLKPALVVIIFGSILTNVSAAKSELSELERRYKLKQELLRKLIVRASQGDTNFNVIQEMVLVNKLFKRYETPKNFNQFSTTSENSTIYRDSGAKETSSGNSKLKEEDLDDLWKSILEDMNKNISHDKESVQPSSDDILTDQTLLKEKVKEEKERTNNYKAKTEVHVIVENPGDFSNAVKDNKVSKFL